jgi:DNA-binding response OmpR family regulator
MNTTPDDAPCILLVDDSPLTLACAEEALREAGYRVRTAPDLSELDAAADGQAYDLILMDVVMPEAYGDDVAAMLKAVRGLEAPILLLSSLDEAELAERVRDAGLDGFIPKSAGIDGMVDRVRSFLAARGAAR